MNPKWNCPKCGESNNTVDGPSCRCGYEIPYKDYEVKNEKSSRNFD